jgi:putative ABC transport system permease protein
VFGMVFSALLRRRAPAVTLLLLTILAAGAAAAAPQYVAAATRDVATADLVASPIGDRTVTVDKTFEKGTLTEDAVRRAGAEARAALPGSGLLAVDQVLIAGGVFSERTNNNRSPLVYRDDVCAHLIIDGRCFAKPGEAIVGTATARSLGLVLGGPVRQTATADSASVRLTVVGIYRARDPGSPYWAGGETLAQMQPGTSSSSSEASAGDAAIFTPLATIVAARPGAANLSVDLVAPADIFLHADPVDVLAAIGTAGHELAGAGYDIDAGLRSLAERAYDDQIRVIRGVPVTVLELLVLCWFALYLSVRYASFERRTDIGLLKLRGAARTRTLALVLGQSAVPMLVGGAVGLAAGVLLARPQSGSISAGTARLADLSSVGAAAVAVLGALVAAFIAERRAVAAPVITLLRRVPARTPGWKAGVIDGALVCLALVGEYQVRAHSRGETSWLALLAPGLLALALGVLIARAMVPAAAAVGRSALREGRVSTTLTAAYLVRRPGLLRLCAVLTAAVALFGAGFAAFDTSVRATAERADHELGAARVLGVNARSRAQLLAAVRAVDPAGRYAMAAAYSPDLQVLAVDTTRLATVARWRPEYGAPTAERAAALLHPPAPVGFTLAGSELALETTANARADPVSILVRLAGPDGAAASATVGPLRPGRHVYHTTVAACAASPGCRLVSIGLRSYRQSLPPGVDVEVHAITADGGRDAGAAAESAGVDLTDRPLWRTPFVGTPPQVATDAGGLRLGTGGAPVADDLDPTVSVLDAPPRIPVLAAGASRERVLAGDPQVVVFPGAQLPATLAGVGGALPRLGDHGLLADLEYADRLAADFGTAEFLEVWLTADAPRDVVARLAGHDVTVATDTSVRDLTERYERQAMPVAVRFQLIAAAIAMLLAAGALAVAGSVERQSRAAELVALRMQGATDRHVRRTALAGYAVVMVLSTLAGLATAVLARTLVATPVPLFSDGWAVLPEPRSIRGWSLAVPAAVAAVVFGTVVAAAAVQLVRSAHGRHPEDYG